MARCTYVAPLDGLQCVMNLPVGLTTCVEGMHRFDRFIRPALATQRRNQLEGRPWIHQLQLYLKDGVAEIPLPAPMGLVHGIAAFSEPDTKSELRILVGEKTTKFPLLYLSHLWPRQIHLHPKEWLYWEESDEIRLDIVDVPSALIVLFGTY